MDDGSAGLLGNISGEMIAEIFALAVNDIRFPFDQLPQVTVVVGNRHPHVRIHNSQGERFDVVYISVNMAFKLFRNRKNPHIMAFLFKLFHQIPNGSHNAVGIDGEKICCNQYFHMGTPS